MKQSFNYLFHPKLKSKWHVFIIVLMTVMVCMPFKPIFAAGLVPEVQDPEVGKVIDIIDGEVVKVWFFSKNTVKPEIRMIKMIGITTNGNDEAFAYTRENLLGQVVYILKDSSASTFPSYKSMESDYVYKELDESFSQTLLKNGYAKVDSKYKKANQYLDLLNAQTEAKASGSGIWENEEINYGSLININTAPYEILKTTFPELTDTDLYKIISYRFYNPINSPEEIKFISSTFNYDWYAAHKNLYTVMTNVNVARIYELSSLFPNVINNLSLAEEIVKYRTFTTIANKAELNALNTISPYYGTIQRFISVVPTNIYKDTTQKVVNVNTGTLSQIVEATGISQQTANKLIALRDEQKYIFQSIGELEKNTNPLNIVNAYEFRDHISTQTDINQCQEFEFLSLLAISNKTDAKKKELFATLVKNRPYADKSELLDFVESGTYKLIEPFIYAYPTEHIDRINLNTANKADSIKYLSMTTSDQTLFTNYKGALYSRATITFNYSAYTNKFTLYTNVNTATSKELLNLNSGMVQPIVDEILALRESQPFASTDELAYIFTKYNRNALFESIKGYLVFY